MLSEPKLPMNRPTLQSHEAVGHFLLIACSSVLTKVLQNGDELLLLDVRIPREFEKTHLPNSTISR